LIDQLALENPKVPSNMLHALTSVRLSQLMDKEHWDFKGLEMFQTNSSDALLENS
jgi:tRNA 2-thiocytidine biosynthesis protein TtcA